jgi:hypothetical protein
MMSYLKLTNFELSRFFKIYVVLIGVTLVMQILGVVFTANNYMGEIEEQLSTGSTVELAILGWGKFSFDFITRGFWFSAPILLCIASLLIYVFFIWYRDWLGKNTFAYRLLMLPTARLNVFLAKATAIFLMVLGLISIQLVFLTIENELMKMIVPSTFREDLTINEIIYGFDYLRVLYPVSLIQFFINYGIGFMAVMVVFTGILFERSFRWKGIILGVLFAGISLNVFFLPILIDEIILNHFFYRTELFFLMFISGLIVIAGSIWMSNYLLNKKIRV